MYIKYKSIYEGMELKLHIYQNDYVPHKDSKLSDFMEICQPHQFEAGKERNHAVFADLECTVYGYFVTDKFGELVGAERIHKPRHLNTSDQLRIATDSIK